MKLTIHCGGETLNKQTNKYINVDCDVMNAFFSSFTTGVFLT
jgi:hypothetical protein